MGKQIDVLSSLILDVYNNKGVYALLLGSGISLSARIMSGWNVTEDLIRKIAITQGKEIHDDPFEWFKNEFECDAEYSSILEQLGKKPAEMESLLRPYFEPSEDDRQHGYKKPTLAHRAIAEMARSGYFKVIITTNFDRLLESALEEIGQAYQVICHESEINSRIPLYHAPLTILKINGDYKDCRFRNTEKELSEYPPDLVNYLDTILKNYGLIVCGWSARWDIALRKQIIEQSQHRYSYYFSHVGKKSDEYDRLIKQVKGECLQIDNADGFFTEMKERLMALEMIDDSYKQVNAEVAITRVKNYISDSSGLIRYTDLFEDVVSQLLTSIQEKVYGRERPNRTLVESVLAEDVAALEVLLPMSLVAIRWAEREHYKVLVNSLNVLVNRKYELPSPYIEEGVDLNHVIEVLYLYGLGIACLYFEKYELLDLLFRVEFLESRDDMPFIIAKDNCWLIDHTVWENSTSFSRIRTPFSTALESRLRPFHNYVQSDREFTALFCVFEKLLAMYYFVFAEKANEFLKRFTPLGLFTWKPLIFESARKSTYSKFFDSILLERENSKQLKSGLFKGDFYLFEKAYNAVTEMEKGTARFYY